MATARPPRPAASGSDVAGQDPTRQPHPALGAFATEVGETGPVAVRGGGTQGDLGGPSTPGTHLVAAPAGIRDLRLEELTVTVGAGTTVAELETELAARGQHVGMEAPDGGTVGGALVAGRTGVHSPGLGPLRDVLLQARAVDAGGRLVTAGGPTVKNVSGFDLCRLWVGSLGTLALLGEVTLRTRPRWPAEVWLAGGADPTATWRAAPEATSVLWDGATVWVHLAGHAADLAARRGELARLGCDEEVEGPPPLPLHRHSLDPAALGQLDPSADGGWVAEVGTGVVHAHAPRPGPMMPRRLYELHSAVKERFDPTFRLNPGRSVLHGVRVAPRRED